MHIGELVRCTFRGAVGADMQILSVFTSGKHVHASIMGSYRHTPPDPFHVVGSFERHPQINPIVCACGCVCTPSATHKGLQFAQLITKCRRAHKHLWRPHIDPARVCLPMQMQLMRARPLHVRRSARAIQTERTVTVWLHSCR